MKIANIKARLQEIGLKKLFRFQAVALLGTLVNLGVLWLTHGILKIPLLIAGIIAIEIAIIHNFSWHYFVTWKSRVRHSVKNYFHLLARYNLVTASIDFAVNLGTLWLLTRFLGVHYLIADICGLLLGPLFKLLANEFWVFPKLKYEQTSIPDDRRLERIYEREQCGKSDRHLHGSPRAESPVQTGSGTAGKGGA